MALALERGDSTENFQRRSSKGALGPVPAPRTLTALTLQAHGRCMCKLHPQSWFLHLSRLRVIGLGCAWWATSFTFSARAVASEPLSSAPATALDEPKLPGAASMVQPGVLEL